MKDKIKFNDAMLTAVMDGRKTQTRRPIDKETLRLFDIASEVGECFPLGCNTDEPFERYHLEFFPYGEIGDIINVADGDGNIKGKIEITDVWVQQIQEISQDDIIAEGITTGKYGNEGNWLTGFYIPNSNQPYVTAKNAYKELWSSIYGIDSWMNNQWVWVIEFKKVEWK